MTTPVPRPKANVPTDFGAKLLPLAAKAIEALKDPETRTKVLAQGQLGLDAVQRLRADRAARGSGDDGASLLRIVHQRLERRQGRVRGAVAALAGGDNALRAGLAPVVEALDGVVKALVVAEALPLRSRRKAHRAIDRVLDDLEDQLLAATLGLTGP